MAESKKKALKERMKSVKEGIKSKVKGKVGKKSAHLAVAALGLAFLAGCMTPEQASRSTNATYGDIKPYVRLEVSGSNTVNVAVHITLGDGAIASADSSGSTDTQTQTPNFDISPKTDVSYNDAISAASATSKGILEALTQSGMEKVQALMTSVGTGTVTVEKKNGGTATVECKDGQCTTCTDCEVQK